jgi:hypothetical protein
VCSSNIIAPPKPQIQVAGDKFASGRAGRGRPRTVAWAELCPPSAVEILEFALYMHQQGLKRPPAVEVAKLLSQGMHPADIARQLGISRTACYNRARRAAQICAKVRAAGMDGPHAAMRAAVEALRLGRRS